jgi:hypothetical protein
MLIGTNLTSLSLLLPLSLVASILAARPGPCELIHPLCESMGHLISRRPNQTGAGKSAIE